VKVFPKVYADASENPGKYGLKLDDPDQEIRARHKQRLDMFLWTPDQCSKLDADGKPKPCVISPPLNSWAQCPTMSQIPNLGKELVEADVSKPKPSSSKSKGVKRSATASDNSIEGVNVMTDCMPGISKILKIDARGCTHSVTVQSGFVYVSLFEGTADLRPSKVARTSMPAAAPAADDDDDDDDDDEQENDDDDDDE